LNICKIRIFDMSDWRPYYKNISVSVEIPACLFQEVIHHYAIPQLDVVVFEFRMSRELYPIIFDNPFQGLVAAQSRKPSFSSNILYVTSNYIIQTILLKSSVLVPNHFEFSRYLPQQKSSLDEFKRHVVEFQKLKVTFNKKWIFVWLKSFIGCFCVDPPAYLNYQSWNIQGKQVNYFVKSLCSCYKVSSSQKL